MYIVNMQEVIGDFRDYDKDTQARFERTLKRYALKVQDKAATTLTRRIIHKEKSTGTLAGSITPDRKNRLTWWIAPLARVVYGEFVETGKPKRGGFRGHWFMRDSIKRLRKPFEEDLKKDIQPR
jgi:hypothetical protein